jgi:hypothetical protein
MNVSVHRSNGLETRELELAPAGQHPSARPSSLLHSDKNYFGRKPLFYSGDIEAQAALIRSQSNPGAGSQRAPDTL